MSIFYPKNQQSLVFRANWATLTPDYDVFYTLSRPLMRQENNTKGINKIAETI